MNKCIRDGELSRKLVRGEQHAYQTEQSTEIALSKAVTLLEPQVWTRASAINTFVDIEEVFKGGL